MKGQSHFDSGSSEPGMNEIEASIGVNRHLYLSVHELWVIVCMHTYICVCTHAYVHGCVSLMILILFCWLFGEVYETIPTKMAGERQFTSLH